LGLISKRTKRHDFLNVCRSGRDITTKLDDAYVIARVILLTTRLSELSCPERLVAIHGEPKALQDSDDLVHIVNGDDHIVTKDTYLAIKGLKVLDGQPVPEPSFDPEEDKC